ncbi:glycosyltransferase [Mycolicibacterium confluentis]|nr:glycosyltransferase [Mycolicibacterium confluentis]ORV34276.1 glycosyl transferase family 1 [Mycolicibacterium confluentis]
MKTHPSRPNGMTSMPRVGVLGPYPPTRCGLAAFGAGLADGLTALGAEVGVVQTAADERSTAPQVIAHLTDGSPASIATCTALLNQHDVAIIQHDYDSYGGPDGADVLEVVEALQVPSIITVHTVLSAPTSRQRSILEALVRVADQVTVMSDAARRRMGEVYDVDLHKISVVPHGAPTLPKTRPSGRFGRPTMLTWGFLRPGKGAESVIDVVDSMRDVAGHPRYMVAGRTHPSVLAQEGEAYRESLVARAQGAGVANSVVVDGNYRGTAALTELIQSSAVVVLANDSAEQVTSGVLAGSIARGRPVVATAFPHAVELLGTGAGIVVGHDDPDALTAALRQVLTQPRLAGAMAAEARRLAPSMGWPAVAEAYLNLARRLTARRSAA